MKGWLIGGILGLIFLKGLTGAIIGGALGYFLFDRRKNASRGARFDPQYGQALIEFTYEMMGYVARSAGRVNEEHIALANEYMNIMQLNEHMRSVARDAFKRGKSSSFDIDNCITNYRAVVGRNLELVTYLLEIQIQVALSDGVLTDNERATLISMAVKLGVSAASMNGLIEKRYQEMAFRKGYSNYSGSSYGGYQERSDNSYSEDRYENSHSYERTDTSTLKAAYALLGVDESAAFPEIKKAYKKMMLKYHPDRLASQGLSEEMIKVYTQKAQDIQAAFDLIRKERGFK